MLPASKRQRLISSALTQQQTYEFNGYSAPHETWDLHSVGTNSTTLPSQDCWNEQSPQQAVARTTTAEFIKSAPSNSPGDIYLLPREVRAKIEILLKLKILAEKDLDIGIVAHLHDVGAETACAILDDFAESYNVSVRNKGGFLVGIIKKYKFPTTVKGNVMAAQQNPTAVANQLQFPQNNNVNPSSLQSVVQPPQSYTRYDNNRACTQYPSTGYTTAAASAMATAHTTSSSEQSTDYVDDQQQPMHCSFNNDNAVVNGGGDQPQYQIPGFDDNTSVRQRLLDWMQDGIIKSNDLSPDEIYTLEHMSKVESDAIFDIVFHKTSVPGSNKGAYMKSLIQRKAFPRDRVQLPEMVQTKVIELCNNGIIAEDTLDSDALQRLASFHPDDGIAVLKQFEQALRADAAKSTRRIRNRCGFLMGIMQRLRLTKEAAVQMHGVIVPGDIAKKLTDLLFVTGQIRYEDLDFTFMNRFVECSPAEVDRTIENIKVLDMTRIRNKASFLMGIVRKVRSGGGSSSSSSCTSHVATDVLPESFCTQFPPVGQQQ